MKIKNPFVAKSWTVGRVILVLWFAFATIFVVYSAWGALNNVIFTQGVQRGVTLGQNDTITRVIQLSQNCNTVSLFSGEGENRVEVGLVNSECSAAQVKAAREATTQQPAVQQPAPAVAAPVVAPQENMPMQEEMPVME
jgi:hypothetical protein